MTDNEKQLQVGGTSFSKARQARQALRERAFKILEDYQTIIQRARDAGDYETAAKHQQWLIEHMPRTDDGDAIIDESAAKPKQVEAKSTGPLIQIIGIKMGGLNTKELPEDVIDVEPE